LTSPHSHIEPRTRKNKKNNKRERCAEGSREVRGNEAGKLKKRVRARYLKKKGGLHRETGAMAILVRRHFRLQAKTKEGKGAVKTEEGAGQKPRGSEVENFEKWQIRPA